MTHHTGRKATTHLYREKLLSLDCFVSLTTVLGNGGTIRRKAKSNGGLLERKSDGGP